MRPRAPLEERVLFICWDAPEAAYLQGLFLPILSALAPHGIHVDVLQFSWATARRAEELERTCELAGVGYRHVPIWRKLRGVGPALSATAAAYYVWRAAREFGSTLLMPRSTLPALAVLASRRLLNLPILFDADGLPLDERVDFAGLPPTGAVYRALRDVEAQMVRRASAVLVRTPFARQVLVARAGPPVEVGRFHVVTNGRDSTRFHPHTAPERARVRAELGVPEAAPLVIYAGSLDGEKYRFDDMLALFARLMREREDARLLVLTASEEFAGRKLKQAPAAVRDRASVRRVSPEHVGSHIAAADLGLAIIAPSFSTQAVAPIKIAEYLLCGVPVIASEGVGDAGGHGSPDVFRWLAANPSESFDVIAEWFVRVLMPERERLRSAARQVGLASFSLEASIDAYRRAIAAVCQARVS